MVTRILLLAGLATLVVGAVVCGLDAAAPDASPPAIEPVIATPGPCGDGRWREGTACLPLADALAPNGTLYAVDARNPLASDANAGTAASPWRTIGRAAQQMQAGDAVVIAAGVYRESLAPPRGGTGASHRITYAAAPGARVIVTGADPVLRGWAPAGLSRWRRAWPAAPLPTYSDDPVFRRELVVARGRVMRPVERVRDLAPGQVAIEGTPEAPSWLTVHLPTGFHPDEIEVATRERLFWPVASQPGAPCGDASQASWLRVAGITFVHAANRAQWGAVCAGRAHGLWEDVTIAGTVGMGVDVGGRDHVFRRVESSDHGQLGWGGGCRRCLFEDTSARRNNWRGFDPFWEAGGGKWVGTTDTVIRRHVAEDNGGPGIWLDGGNARNTIEGCRAERNEVAGIMLELDTVETLVQHNVVRGTRWREWSGSGILSQAASRNALWHNTVVDNDGMGVWLRLDPLHRAPDVSSRVEANWIVGNARDADEAREIAVEAETPALVRSHAFANNVYGQPPGDPTLISTFFLAPLAGGGDYRGSDIGVWMQHSGETGARRAARSRSPVRDGVAPSAGAPGAPAIPYGYAGADPARVAR